MKMGRLLIAGLKGELLAYIILGAITLVIYLIGSLVDFIR